VIRVRLGDPLPPAAPEQARWLGRAAARGVRVAGTVLLLDVADGPDVALAGALGPLPPGRVDLLALPGAAVRDVPTVDVAALAQALRVVMAAPAVLVQPQVAAVHGGRAGLRRDRPYDLVRAVEGSADALETAQEVRVLHVPVLPHPWSRPHRGADVWHTPLPPWGMRLSRVLRRLRVVLPGEELDVLWADDGRRLHVLGLAPPT
jgi:hypothetical protein